MSLLPIQIFTNPQSVSNIDKSLCFYTFDADKMDQKKFRKQLLEGDDVLFERTQQ